MQTYNEFINEARVYNYKFNSKENRYDVLKNGDIITHFSKEDVAKSHTDKLNRLSRGYAKLAAALKK